MTVFAAAFPEPDVIRRKAAEVLQRPEYQPDVTDTDKGLTALILDALRWVWEVLRSFAELLEGLPDWLQWVIQIGLVLLLVLLVGHIMYTLAKATRGPTRLHEAEQPARRSRNPHELEQLAADAGARQDYIEAVRLLFRAGVLRLEIAEKRVNRPGTTNRELLRRYRTTPLFDALKLLVDTIDDKWYGDHGCTREDYEACRTAHARLRHLAGQAGPSARQAA
jgi:hypothetical protein